MEQAEQAKLLKIGQFDFINVLLTGETGTGKTYYARLIHQNSLRKHKPFVAINCASLPKDLIEAELFGAERGSFTGAISTIIGKFEAASGGTIFLDEIGELDQNLQAKLLTVLEDKTIRRLGSKQLIKLDVRFIFATNQDLSIFRSDFRCRISGYQFEIKPLRERKNEISHLVKYFLSELNQTHNQELHFKPCILDFIKSQEWFGNVRELKNFINRLYVAALIKELKFINSKLLDDFELNLMPRVNPLVMKETIPQVLLRNGAVHLNKNEAEAFELYLKKELSVRQIFAQTGVSQSTFYRKLSAINLKNAVAS